MLRRSLLLLKEHVIDFTDYGFYIFLALLGDWDKNHKTYGYVVKPQNELATSAGCHSSTVGRRLKNLEKANLISIEGTYIKIIDYPKFSAHIAQKLAKQTVADLQEDKAQTQFEIAKQQEDIAVTQTQEPEKGK